MKIFLEVLICCFIGKCRKVSLKTASCAKKVTVPQGSRGEIHSEGPSLEMYLNTALAAQRSISDTHTHTLATPPPQQEYFLPPLFPYRWGMAAQSRQLVKRGRGTYKPTCTANSHGPVAAAEVGIYRCPCSTYFIFPLFSVRSNTRKSN